jgi:hypothetical protein
MAGDLGEAYDRHDVVDHSARRDLPARFSEHRAPCGDSRRGEAMNPVVLEIGLIVLSAVSFWLLDRYVIGCENI